jgi:crossover junction endodeoxyribonuclease RuvC
MLILGVDPGTSVTGFGVIESDGSRHRCLEYGAVNLPQKKPMPERLALLHSALCNLIAKYTFQAVALEDLFHAVNVQSAMKLSQARGVIMLAAAQHGIPLFEYSPLEVKNAVVGYGRAEKSQVQIMVSRLLGLARLPAPLDAADALAVAICHAQTDAVQQRIEQSKKRPKNRL